MSQITNFVRTLYDLWLFYYWLIMQFFSKVIPIRESTTRATEFFLHEISFLNAGTEKELLQYGLHNTQE